METEVSSVVLILNRELVNELARVWGEEGGGGLLGEGVKIQGAHCFSRACITHFFPLNKTLFSTLADSSLPFSFSPPEELSQLW